MARTGQGGLHVTHVSRFTNKYRACHLNYLWNIEDKFHYDTEYPLSRLLPTIGDMEEFHRLSGDLLLSLSFLERLQLFLNWLTCLEKGLQINSVAKLQKLFPSYNIGNSAGVPAKTNLETILSLEFGYQKKVEEHPDYRRFTQR